MQFKTESDKWLVITALNATAEKWDQWAADLCVPAVKEQFAQQAKDARRIAAEIEENG